MMKVWFTSCKNMQMLPKVIYEVSPTKQWFLTWNSYMHCKYNTHNDQIRWSINKKLNRYEVFQGKMKPCKFQIWKWIWRTLKSVKLQREFRLLPMLNLLGQLRNELVPQLPLAIVTTFINAFIDVSNWRQILNKPTN